MTLMEILELVGGILLLITSILIICVVMLQESRQPRQNKGCQTGPCYQNCGGCVFPFDHRGEFGRYFCRLKRTGIATCLREYVLCGKVGFKALRVQRGAFCFVIMCFREGRVGCPVGSRY